MVYHEDEWDHWGPEPEAPLKQGFVRATGSHLLSYRCLTSFLTSFPVEVTIRGPCYSRRRCDECQTLRFLKHKKVETHEERKHICPECRLAKLVKFFLALSALWVLKGLLAAFLHHWQIFHEWPDDDLQRFSLYRWPYNMRVPVAVLWGMCWKFAVHDETPYQFWGPEDFSWDRFLSEDQILSDLFPSVVDHRSQPLEAPGPADSREPRVSFGNPAIPQLAHKSPPLDLPQGSVADGYPLPDEATRGYEPTVYAQCPTGGTMVPLQINIANATASPTSGARTISQPEQATLNPRGHTDSPAAQEPPASTVAVTPVLSPPVADQPRKHKCQHDGCSESFDLGRQLDAHVAQQHGQSRYKCEVCKEPFKRSDNMIKHVETKHPDEWPDTEAGKNAIRKRVKKAEKNVERRQLAAPSEGSSGGGTPSVQIAAPVAASPAYVAGLVAENEILRAENERLWKLVDSLTVCSGRRRRNKDDDGASSNAGGSKGHRKRRRRGD